VPTGTATPNGAKIAVVKAVALPAAGLGLEASTSKSFLIRNVGKNGNLIGSLSLTQTAATFALTTSPTFTIPPHASATETVTYLPATSLDTATLTITSNDAKHGLLDVTLRGRGLLGRLAVPAGITIVGDTIGQPTTATLTLKNAGRGLVTGSWSAVTPTTAAPFSVAGSPFFSLTPGAKTTIPITFTPAVKGRATNAALIIMVNSPSTGGRTVTLRGIGK
jgi:hypothetical protein